MSNHTTAGLMTIEPGFPQEKNSDSKTSLKQKNAYIRGRARSAGQAAAGSARLTPRYATGVRVPILT